MLEKAEIKGSKSNSHPDEILGVFVKISKIKEEFLCIHVRSGGKNIKKVAFKTSDYERSNGASQFEFNLNKRRAVEIKANNFYENDIEGFHITFINDFNETKDFKVYKVSNKSSADTPDYLPNLEAN